MWWEKVCDFEKKEEVICNRKMNCITFQVSSLEDRGGGTDMLFWKLRLKSDEERKLKRGNNSLEYQHEET